MSRVKLALVASWVAGVSIGGTRLAHAQDQPPPPPAPAPAPVASPSADPVAPAPATPAPATTPAPAPAEEPEESGGWQCLDEDMGRRKGVQQKDFLKRNRVEVAAVGGFLASDVLSSAWSAGASLAFFPGEDLGLEAMATYGPIHFRLEEPFNAWDRERHFLPGSALQVLGALLLSPLHAKFKFTDATIVHGDIFFIVGGGRTWHSSVQGLTWQAGGGLKLYLAKRLSLRIDVRDLILPQEVLGRGRVGHNLLLLMGLALWLG